MKSNIKTYSIVLVLAALMLFSLSACKGSAKAAQPLNIGILPDVDSIPLVIAQQNGYFAKEGANIVLERFKSAAERDAALQAGKIDGAVSDVLAAAFAAEGGFEVKITSLTNGSYKLLVGKDSGINSFKDLKGKSVAISKNTIIEYATDVMLDENSVSPNDINKMVIPQIPVRLEMLQAGKVDAATLPEPLASSAVKAGARLLNSSDKLGINPGILLFTKKAADTRTADIKAFYKAYNRAVEYLNTQKTSSYIDILIKEAGFPEDVRDVITLPAYTKASLPTEKDFDSVLKWLGSRSLVKKSHTYKDLVDTRFAGKS